MKRYGNLFPEIIDFGNLVTASRKARRGKRFCGNVLEFNDRLEENLFDPQQEPRTETYRPGKYRVFRIHDPKPRLISAAPYRDRVVYHAHGLFPEPLAYRCVYDFSAIGETFSAERLSLKSSLFPREMGKKS